MSKENEKLDKTVDTIQGERSLPSVNTAKRSKNNTLAIFFGVCSLLITGLYGYFSFFSWGESEVDEGKAIVIDPGKSLRMDTIDLDPIDIPPPTPPVVVNNEKKDPEPPKPKVIVKPPPPILIDHSSGKLMVSTKDRAKEKAEAKEKEKKAASAVDRSALGERLISTKTEKVAAAQIRNRDFVLTKGTVINCSLQTQLDTSVPGFVSCVTTRDVYSDTGTILLLERGSQVVGEYQGNVEEGVTRLFILWTRVKTPNGIIVDLNSPATDPLGGAGADGYVKSRFWQRFGAAMLLSVLDEAYSTATSLAKINLATRQDRKDRRNLASTERFEEQLMMQIYASKKQMELAQQWEAAGMDLESMPTLTFNSGESYLTSSREDRPQFDIGSGTSPFSEVIGAVLSKKAGIPEVMTKNRGEKISIFVARDLDFSEVYDVNTQ